MDQTIHAQTQLAKASLFRNMGSEQLACELEFDAHEVAYQLGYTNGILGQWASNPFIDTELKRSFEQGHKDGLDDWMFKQMKSSLYIEH